jgi:hypothetical protein
LKPLLVNENPVEDKGNGFETMSHEQSESIEFSGSRIKKDIVTNSLQQSTCKGKPKIKLD